MGKPNVNVIIGGPNTATQIYKTVVLKSNLGFAEQITDEKGVKYIIKWNYDLHGATITIPQNCILEFDGGVLTNGTIIGQDTVFNNVGNLENVFGEDLILEGTWIDNFGKVQSDWVMGDTEDPSYIKNKPNLAAVATSGSYNDLTNKPTLSTVAKTGSYNDLSDKPTIPIVPTNVSAFTNDAGYLTEHQSLDNYYTKNQVDGQQQTQDAAIALKANSADLATVATSGSYNDLSNKPTIPSAPVQSNWNETNTSSLAYIQNKPGLATVATTGSYNDLTDQPIIPDQVQSDWTESSSESPAYIQHKPILGSAASKNVPATGNAQSNQVVLGSDSRLSDARSASDVYDWAKQSSKPSYNLDEVSDGTNRKLSDYISSSEKAQANGVATLDDNGKIPSDQLPGSVDEIINGYYNTQTGKFYEDSSYTKEITPEVSKIYVDLSSNKVYRWSGSAYVEISASLALGETASTAYYGDKGKIAYTHSQSSHAPSDANKADVSYNTGSKKLTKIINGTTSDVVTAEKIVADGIKVDDQLSSSSENPVQNKVIYEALQTSIDKSYDPVEFSGLGKVYLKKNLVTVGGVQKNVLVQDAFYKGESGSRVPNTDTIFVAQYDFDLNGQEIVLPQNSVVEFEGGSINNGTIKMTPWCSIVSADGYAACSNLYIKLNYRCLVEKLKIEFTSWITSDGSIISYTLSDGFAYYNGNEFHNSNIVLRDLDLRQPALSESETHTKYGYGVKFLADDINHSTEHYVQSMGCYNINFDHVLVTGEFKAGFDFEVAGSDQIEPHWFTQLNFNNCFTHSCANGFIFNGNATKGKVAQVAIIECGYQACATFGYGIVANNTSRISICGTEFWDCTQYRGGNPPASEENAIIRLDSSCFDVCIDRISSTDSVKAVSIKNSSSSGTTYWYTANNIKIGAESNYTRNILSYLDFTQDITVAQLYDIPDGIYVLRVVAANPDSTKVLNENVKTHFGIDTLEYYNGSGEGAADLLISIYHAYNYVKVEVNKATGVYPDLAEPCYAFVGVINKNTTTYVKDKWVVTDVCKVVDSKGKLERLPVFNGRRVFLSNIMTTVTYCNGYWVDNDSRVVFDTVNL